MSSSSQPTDGQNRNNNSPDTDASQRIEKEVMITAYARNGHIDDRSFIDNAFGQWMGHGEDLYRKKTTTEEDFEITISFELENPFGLGEDTTHEFSETYTGGFSSFKNGVRQALEEGAIDPDEVDWIDITAEEYETSYFKYGLHRPIENMIGAVARDIHLPEDLGYEQRDQGSSLYDAQWDREVPAESPDTDPGETDTLKVTISGSYEGDIKRRRVLTHRSERSPENRYETPEDADKSDLPWSLTFTVSIEATSEEDMDELSEQIVTPLREMLQHNNEIGKIRLSDCEQKTIQEGECYNL